MSSYAGNILQVGQDDSSRDMSRYLPDVVSQLEWQLRKEREGLAWLREWEGELGQLAAEAANSIVRHDAEQMVSPFDLECGVRARGWSVGIRVIRGSSLVKGPTSCGIGFYGWMHEAESIQPRVNIHQ